MIKTTLAIETSCDDTSVALVQEENGYFSCEMIHTDSQISLHNTYGGVVPEFAYREHAQRILGVIQRVGGNELRDRVDTITVTARPGLPGALLVGISVAHTLGALWNKPVLEVNHIMGHVFSVLLGRRMDKSSLPYICLTVSGGHTDIYFVQSSDYYKKIVIQDDANWIKRQHLGIGQELEVGPFYITKVGQTRDDAAGEAFDKVARMLGGPYPGGAWLSNLAQSGQPDERISFRAPSLDDESLDMSFSGLKSQVYNLLRSFEQQAIHVDEHMKANIAYAFEQTITSMLSDVFVQGVKRYNARSVGLVGGVAANNVLRDKIQEKLDVMHLSCITPTQYVYCTDNAAMIGVVGLLHMKG